MEINERFKTIIPPLSPEELSQLEENILKDGIRDPLVVWEGTLIDGHNRYAISKKHGLKYETVEKAFDTEMQAEEWIILNQFGRRNITSFVRAELALKLKPIIAEKAKENQRGGQGGVLLPQNYAKAKTETRKEIAEIANVSHDTIARVEKIKESAPLEIVDKVRSGEMSINQAYTQHVKNVHVSNNSGENEWYTPKNIIEAARAAMGSIDFDPASCALANETVQAVEFKTKEDNGLLAEWWGNVWMNPPYASPLIKHFCDKAESERGNYNQAIILVNNATETGWFKTLVSIASAICFTSGRVRFIDKQGNPSGAPLQGQAVVYIGEHQERFKEAFGEVGWIARIEE